MRHFLSCIIVYLLYLKVTERQSCDLCLSVAERTSACDGLATECMLGRLNFSLNHKYSNGVGPTFIISELKPPPNLEHPVSNQENV